MSGIGNNEGWRWIFIVGGLITIVGAVACYFFIVDWPEKAKFLNDQERALLLRRILEDEAEAIMDRFDKKSAVRFWGLEDLHRVRDTSLATLDNKIPPRFVENRSFRMVKLICSLEGKKV